MRRDFTRWTAGISDSEGRLFGTGTILEPEDGFSRAKSLQADRKVVLSGSLGYGPENEFMIKRVGVNRAYVNMRKGN